MQLKAGGSVDRANFYLRQVWGRIHPSKALSTVDTATIGAIATDGRRTEEDIALVVSVRIQLLDEMKAVDTRAGIVIVLCSALALAPLAEAEHCWRAFAIFLSFAGAAAGVIALLAGTMEGGEPGLNNVRNRVSQTMGADISRLDVELRWLDQVAKVLSTRKRCLFISYVLFLGAAVSIAIAYMTALAVTETTA